MTLPKIKRKRSVQFKNITSRFEEEDYRNVILEARRLNKKPAALVREIVVKTVKLMKENTDA